MRVSIGDVSVEAHTLGDLFDLVERASVVLVVTPAQYEACPAHLRPMLDEWILAGHVGIVKVER